MPITEVPSMLLCDIFIHQGVMLSFGLSTALRTHSNSVSVVMPKFFLETELPRALRLPRALLPSWLADLQPGALLGLLQLPGSAALPGHRSTRDASQRCPAWPTVPTVLTGCHLLLQACQHQCPEAGRGRRRRTRCCFPRSRTQTGSPPATLRSSCMTTATRSTSNSTATSECGSPRRLVETVG